MLAISWRNLWEHKLRTLLLGGAIVVGSLAVYLTVLRRRAAKAALRYALLLFRPLRPDPIPVRT